MRLPCFLLAIHNAVRYHWPMTESFRCKVTERVFHGQAAKRFPHDLLKRARMRLDRIDAASTLDDLRVAASTLDDLRVPPSHHLEALEVFQGNTADPSTLGTQIAKLKERFEWQNVIVGDGLFPAQHRLHCRGDRPGWPLL
ncbi:MAG: hypothetical protein HQL63_07910 [Magnetococcales bacterium]|nr:hypothetical protein [Magnetococcales bacterium]